MFELNIYPSQYTSISSNYPDSNYADCDYLLTGINADDDIYRSLLKFDLDGLPKNIFISSAIISLYCEKNESGNKSVFTPFLLSSDWQKEDVTWNLQPNIDFLVSGSSLDVLDNSRYEWDITDIARKWIKHKKHNHGLLLKSSENAKDMCRFLAQCGHKNKPCLKLSLCCFRNTKLTSRKVCSIKKEYETKRIPQCTDWFKVSKYSMYTFFVQNLGTSAVIAQVQISPDKEAVFNENAIYRISKKSTTAITPMQYTFYNRLLFKTVPPGKPSTIKVWFQAQV